MVQMYHRLPRPGEVMNSPKEVALDKLVDALIEMRDYIEDQACICKEIDENPEDVWMRLGRDRGWTCGAHEIYEALDEYLTAKEKESSK